jgi:hypothetical protein
MKKRELTHLGVAELLDGFVAGTPGRWDWDDFTLGVTFRDKRLQEIQARCRGLSFEFPPPTKEMYTGEQGVQVIRDYAAELRRSSTCAGVRHESAR